MREDNHQKLVDEVEAQKAKIEENFWHSHYDYLVKRCIDLGPETI